VNVTDQLSLLETPAHGAAPVWSTLDAERRALVVSTLARLMAKAVADLRAPVAAAKRESDHE